MTISSLMRTALAAAAIAAGITAAAQSTDPAPKRAAAGGLGEAQLRELRDSYKPTAADRALHNALAGTDINRLATAADSHNGFDTHFSHRVPSKGITNQRSSGRCWLFTGLNMLRAQMMQAHDLPLLELSQNYNFFYDQLEKANLFLQTIIDTSGRPMDDKTVDWLFRNPLGDGGQFTGVADLITKYGVVPADVMNETNSSNNTSRMSNLIGLKLKEWGLQLRDKAAAGTPAKALEADKQQMLKEVYRMLALNLGVPPQQFEWTRKDASGKPVDTRVYTPQEFYREYAGNDLRNGYVMLMNDPSREYYKLYEIDLDRHTYDGSNWTYVNLPVEDIKAMAIASIKDSAAMYFSCDVGKFFDRDRGVLDTEAYDYGSLFGTEFGMDKRQRILTHSSGSSHAMTLVAVDLDDQGKPRKWMVENSWGPGPNSGHLIMTDKWFDEYMFRLVVDKKYITPRVAEILKQKPVMLPAWDPMFAPEL